MAIVKCASLDINFLTGIKTTLDHLTGGATIALIGDSFMYRSRYKLKKTTKRGRRRELAKLKAMLKRNIARIDYFDLSDRYNPYSLTSMSKSLESIIDGDGMHPSLYKGGAGGN